MRAPTRIPHYLRATSPDYQPNLEIGKNENSFKLGLNAALLALVTKIIVRDRSSNYYFLTNFFCPNPQNGQNHTKM